MRNDSPYTPLLNNGSHNNNRNKEIHLIVFGFLLLASLITFSGYIASNNNVVSVVPHADVSFSDEVTKPNTVVSRGVSAGVSEKSNMFLSAAGGNKVVGESESFPWNNTMLSWQRTAFHFQPEKNWMN
ncbi:acid beta-fructofuranosidase-like protein, partial [Trifolium pratense]